LPLYVRLSTFLFAAINVIQIFIIIMGNRIFFWGIIFLGDMPGIYSLLFIVGVMLISLLPHDYKLLDHLAKLAQLYLEKI
jgi:hypothetical protein